MRKGKMIKKLESAPIVKFLEDEDSNFQVKKPDLSKRNTVSKVQFSKKTFEYPESIDEEDEKNESDSCEWEKEGRTINIQTSKSPMVKKLARQFIKRGQTSTISSFAFLDNKKKNKARAKSFEKKTCDIFEKLDDTNKDVLNDRLNTKNRFKTTRSSFDEFFFQLGGGGYRNFYDNNMMNAYDQLNNVKNDASNPFRFIK